MSFYQQNGPKKAFFRPKRGSKFKISKKFKKVPLDILEIHVVFKFGPVPMKIVAGSSLEHKQTTTVTTDFSVPKYTNILIYSSSLPPNSLPTYYPD